MKILAKTALFVASLLLSAGIGFAADVKAPAPGAVKAAGESAKTDAKASATAVKDSAKSKAADAKAKIVDINSATEAELKAIPGIGDVYAAKIIAGRPYANKTQLKSRKIVPSNVYEQVKDLVIAKVIKK